MTTSTSRTTTTNKSRRPSLRRRVDSRGRLTSRPPPNNWNSRSLLPVFFWSFILAVLLYTNPLNQPSTSAWDMRRSTNYGLFYVQDRTIKLRLAAATLHFDCDYDATSACVILRNTLVLETADSTIVTRLHQVWWAILVVVNLLLVGVVPGLLVPLVSVFRGPTRVSILNLPLLLFSVNVLLYPAWIKLAEQTQAQTAQSLFRLVDDSDTNVVLSVVLTVLAASLLNRLVGNIQHDTLIAWATGYLAVHQSDYFGNVNFTIWVVLVSNLVRYNVAGILCWGLAFGGGQWMASYHHEHRMTLTAAAQTIQGFTTWLLSQ